MDETPSLALQLAVERIGSQSAVARLLGVVQPTVHLWLKEQKPVPAKHVLKLEAALAKLGSGISRHDLRPDLYPREAAPPPRPESYPDGLEPAR